ncbi:hypothetical protein K438DRAFT_2036962 [Mycena galopus ATCC 62051]|nr:hypothetical protein K438DRAFT_2036962 [Mycena galopus ATCC 62051]
MSTQKFSARNIHQRALEAEGHTPQLARALTIRDLHALVVKLEERMDVQERIMAAQDKKITILQQESSELWQEIHRVRRTCSGTFRHVNDISQLKGPRFPLEIPLLIVNAVRDDKKALKTFSLVCKSWMRIARQVLFARLDLSAMFWFVKIEPETVLNDPHCTVFPYVQKIGINGSMDDGSGCPTLRNPIWMDKFLLYMPKYTSLTSLELYHFDPLDLDILVQATPPAIKRRLRGIDIASPVNLTMPLLAGFLSHFTALTSLECGDVYEAWDPDVVAYLLGSNEAMVPPPASITKLVLWESGHLPSNILTWFTDLHSGVIESFDANELSTSHPVEFRNFIDRFWASLSEIKILIGNEEAVRQFLHAQYFVTLRQLRCIVLNVSGDVFNWLPKILEQVQPGIERISLVVSNNQLPDVAEAQWSQLDHTLVRTTLSSLRNVTVRIFNLVDEEQQRKEEIEQYLPRCMQKKILTVKFGFS